MIGLGLTSCQDAASDLFMSSPPLFTRIDPDTYRHVCSQFATGVAVATVRAAAGTPHGLTVSSFTPVSIEPPLILICIDLRSSTVNHFRTCAFFAINVLAAAQRELSVVFATKPEGRFDGLEWHPGPTGCPIFPAALAIIECKLDRVVEAGDHVVLFGEMVHTQTHPGDPLIYFNRTYRSLL